MNGISLDLENKNFRYFLKNSHIYFQNTNIIYGELQGDLENLNTVMGHLGQKVKFGTFLSGCGIRLERERDLRLLSPVL